MKYCAILMIPLLVVLGGCVSSHKPTIAIGVSGVHPSPAQFTAAYKLLYEAATMNGFLATQDEQSDYVMLVHFSRDPSEAVAVLRIHPRVKRSGVSLVPPLPEPPHRQMSLGDAIANGDSTPR